MGAERQETGCGDSVGIALAGGRLQKIKKINFVVLLIMNLLHKYRHDDFHKKFRKNNSLCFANFPYLIEMCPPTDKTSAINIGRKVHSSLCDR